MNTSAQNDITDLKILIEQKLIDPDSLIRQIKNYLPDFDGKKFKIALEFAALAHHGQMRKESGVPYLIHPFETARILASLHADETTLIASLLHDVPEDTTHTLKEIEEQFGKKVAYLVEGITKLSKVYYRNDMVQREVDTLKKMFVHIAEDPRTILIKLADRLHNLRTLEFMDVPEKRERKARETLEIFAPIAGLLGIRELQTELEELCFQNLYPLEFSQLKEIFEQTRAKDRETLENSVKDVEEALKKNKLQTVIYSKYPTLYSVFKALHGDRRKFDSLESRFRIYILVNALPECYQALGVIHSLYRPVPGTVRDYISLPKPNGYQGLHTTAFGADGIRTKFLIRTHQMHFNAQYGIVASNFLKKSPMTMQEILGRAQWFEEVINIQKSDISRDDYLKQLKGDIFVDKITVITPRGKAVELPHDATCIDFAYAIHTQVGHRAVRAQVNDVNVPLNHQLKKGDVVKIITTDYAKSPNFEWLAFSKTVLARDRIKEFFRKESQSSKIQLGRKILQKEYDRAGLGLVSQLSKWKMKTISENHPRLHLQKLEDILIQIGEGNLSSLEVVKLIGSPKKTPSSELSSSTGLKSKVRLEIKITAEPDVNFSDLLDVITSRQDQFILLKSQTTYSPWSQKVTINSSILVNSYQDISELCNQFEHIDGVIKVERLFWKRKMGFFMISIFTFIFWMVHPLVMNYLSSNWIPSHLDDKLLPNIVLFSGLFVLLGLIFSIKKFTENSIPELRESRRLWIVAYLLCFFALLTIVMEIVFFQIQFEWFYALISMVLVFAYLSGQYLFQNKEKDK